MPTRFDHLVIAVRDLDAAIRQYRQLGFEVRYGGRHTGRGTHNAIIRFGLDYIELLSVYNKAEALASGHRGSRLLEILEKHEEILLGFALATNDITREAEQFRKTELFASEPFPMERLLPDGHLLAWRLFIPGGTAWRRPWPFLFQWDTSDTQRLQLEQPTAQPNGASHWSRVAVAVATGQPTIDLYRQQLGLKQLESIDVSQQVASCTTFRSGTGNIDLLISRGEGPLHHMLDRCGEGPVAFSLTVDDLAYTRHFLTQSNIPFEHDATGAHVIRLTPQAGVPFYLYLAGPDADFAHHAVFQPLAY